MGSGKSLLGKRLAKGIGYDFYDLDSLIEKGEEMKIPNIFAEKGEGHFRLLEAKYLREMANFPNAIIATGGGTPCFSENMEWMNRVGITLYLKASVDTLVERLRKEKSGRPLISGKTDEDLHLFIDGLLSERRRFYTNSKYACKADLDIDLLSEKLIGYFQRFIN